MPPKSQEKPLPTPEPPTESARHAAAIARLIEEHNSVLRAFLMTRVRDENEAREIAQEAYVQMLQLDRPGTISFLRAYLFKTAANIAINRSRQRRTRAVLDVKASFEPPINDLTPERWVLADEELAIVQRALFELPPKCRRAFVLYRFMDWSQLEIANDLKVQERMVRKYLSYAGTYCRQRVLGYSVEEAKARVKDE